MITHLYVKIHKDTKLKYFGKTIRDPYKYDGSGKYWTRHLKTHGKNVHTIVLCSFENREDCIAFATKFSVDNNITNSKCWANLRDENGVDGAPVGHVGHKFTEGQLKKISEASRKNWTDPAFRQKTIEAQRQSFDEERLIRLKELSSKNWTDEKKKKHSKTMSEILKTNPEWADNFLKYVKGKRSQKHRQSIKNALTGKEKSQAHKDALSWLRIKDNCKFKSYAEFSKYCIDSYNDGASVEDICSHSNVGKTAVYKAIKRHQSRI